MTPGITSLEFSKAYNKNNFSWKILLYIQSYKAEFRKQVKKKALFWLDFGLSKSSLS